MQTYDHFRTLPKDENNPKKIKFVMDDYYHIILDPRETYSLSYQSAFDMVKYTTTDQKEDSSVWFKIPSGAIIIINGGVFINACSEDTAFKVNQNGYLEFQMRTPDFHSFRLDDLASAEEFFKTNGYEFEISYSEKFINHKLERENANAVFLDTSDGKCYNFDTKTGEKSCIQEGSYLELNNEIDCEMNDFYNSNSLQDQIGTLGHCEGHVSR